MSIQRWRPDPRGFNSAAQLPYNLRLKDFELAMQDVYDFFYDVNVLMHEKSLERIDDILRTSAEDQTCLRPAVPLQPRWMGFARSARLYASDGFPHGGTV